MTNLDKERIYINYEKITEVIVEVTGLNVPVYFNDKEADCIGTPYFGVGEHCWDIVPEDMLDNPMFVAEDFFENKHLKYYHVGLPNKILGKHDDDLFKVTQEQLDERNINVLLNKPLLETYIILHEFGHAHELFISYNGNVEAYLAKTYEENAQSIYEIRTSGLAGTEEGLRLHKKASTEKYADNFALQNFEEVIKVAKERQLI